VKGLDLVALTVAPDADEDTSRADRLLDAALEQFQHVGLRRCSMEDVARRAGVSRVTLYRRFPQKDKLVQAVLLREVQRLIAGTRAVMAALDSVEDRMIEAFVHVLRTTRTHPLLTRLLAVEPEDVLVFLTARAGPIVAIGSQFIADQIKASQRAKEIPVYDAKPVAEMLARLAHSLMLTPHGGLPLDTDAQVRAFARRCVAPLLLRDW
jgi:AcrR family transcriptional regulator